MKGILGKNKWIAVLLCITMLLCISPLSPLAVSYTHLDVYKRQV